MEMARGIKEDDTARVEEMGSKRAELLSEIKKVIVGQEHPIEEILITLFCRGHALRGDGPEIQSHSVYP
jgi:hypothetical protein